MLSSKPPCLKGSMWKDQEILSKLYLRMWFHFYVVLGNEVVFSTEFCFVLILITFFIQECILHSCTGLLLLQNTSSVVVLWIKYIQGTESIFFFCFPHYFMQHLRLLVIASHHCCCAQIPSSVVVTRTVNKNSK